VTVDRHYTPFWLADRLISELPEGFSGSILDPTAGTGSLLSAAERRFGRSAKLFGIDSDEQAHMALQAASGVTSSSRADFLNHRAVASTRVFRHLSRYGLDWVVLNPPFSYRGSGGVLASLDGCTVRLPTALAFVWRSMSAIRPKAGIVALLPAGVLTSERGLRFMSWASKSWEISEPMHLGGKVFAKATVDVVLIRFDRKRVSDTGIPFVDRQLPPLVPALPADVCSCVEVIRGRVPVARMLGSDTGSTRFVHTREIALAADGQSSASEAGLRWSTSGLLLVLPRVGNPTSFRVRIVDGPVILSDCVYALRFASVANRQWLEREIGHQLPDLLSRYTGSGAKHLTIPMLLEFLNKLGSRPTHVPASKGDFRCKCRLASVSNGCT
jgi:hypothetical protein